MKKVPITQIKKSSEETALTTQHKPSPYLAATIIEAQKDLEACNISKGHKDADSLMNDLES